mgnify:CR=1 FL=1
MGGNKYYILDYVSGRIIGPLIELSEVCVTARILMQISAHPHFDITYETYVGRKEFVTKDFLQTEDKTWIHSPAPEECVEAGNIKGDKFKIPLGR